MYTDLPLHERVQALIGNTGRFKNEIEMARFLGLGETRHTKLYDFLAGSDTRYKAVLEWVYRLGGRVELGAESVPVLPCESLCSYTEATRGEREWVVTQEEAIVARRDNTNVQGEAVGVQGKSAIEGGGVAVNAPAVAEHKALVAENLRLSMEHKALVAENLRLSMENKALMAEKQRLDGQVKALQGQVDELKGALKYADSLIEKASSFDKATERLF